MSMLGDTIRQLRDVHKMNMSDLAEKSGVSQGAISLIENGKRSPNRDTLEKLAFALNVSFDHLYDASMQDDFDNIAVKNNISGINEDTPIVIKRGLSPNTPDIVVETKKFLGEIDIKSSIRINKIPKDELTKHIYKELAKSFELALFDLLYDHQEEFLNRLEKKLKEQHAKAIEELENISLILNEE